MGGIGSCGRELCCSTWLNDFRSVGTSAARYQQLSLNPQKLAGQCGKLKCCLNYELDMYVEAIKGFPESNVKLKTKKGDAFMQKMDIFKRKVWYSYHSEPSHFIELNLEKVQEIVSQNKQGEFPDSLEIFVQAFVEEPKHDYENVVGQDSITRFDKHKGKRPNKKRNQRSRKSVNANAQNRSANHQNPSSKSGATSDHPRSKKQNASKSSNRRRRNGQKPSGNRSNKNDGTKTE